MVYRHALANTTYIFEDLRDLLAKATPPRSGDRLAGIAADSAEQMMAARIALADVPLTQFLHESVIPYEDDEVTRLIVDSHDRSAFAPISALTVGSFREWLLSAAATPEILKKTAPGITAEMAAAEKLPFAATIPQGEQAAIATHWDDLFGGWIPTG